MAIDFAPDAEATKFTELSAKGLDVKGVSAPFMISLGAGLIDFA